MKKLFLSLLVLFTSICTFAQQDINTTIKNAENGNKIAQYNLAATYFSGGQGLPQDYKKAFVWAEKSALQGFVPAYNLLGNLYMEGQGTAKDLNKAEAWLKKGVEVNDIYCMFTLGQLYASKQMNRYEEGIKLLTALAEKDDYYAMNALGLAYNDLGQNDTAIEWFNKAAAKGSLSAKANLGALYLNGRNGFPIDYDKAALWNRHAAEAGSKIAKHNLPIAYYKLGEMLLLEKEFDDAVIYLMRAASNEDNPIPEAMRKLSACFRYGYGVEKDASKEDFYMKEAAKLNDAKAMEILGF